MSLIQQACDIVDSWDEGMDFWRLCEWTARTEGGHVVIFPDFIAVGQVEGDTINVWLALGKDGVRKAIELAPHGVKYAAWRRSLRNKDDKPRAWPIDRIKRWAESSQIQ